MLTQDVRRGRSWTRNRPSGGQYCARFCTDVIPRPEPDQVPVSIDITVPNNVALTISVNGETAVYRSAMKWERLK